MSFEKCCSTLYDLLPISYMLFITEDLYIGVSWYQNKFRTTLPDLSQLLPTMYCVRLEQECQIISKTVGQIQVQAEETCPEETW